MDTTLALDRKVLASVLNGREMASSARADASEVAARVVRTVAAKALEGKQTVTLGEADVERALAVMGLHSAELQHHLLQLKHRGYAHEPAW
jgi:hypothetical protein